MTELIEILKKISHKLPLEKSDWQFPNDCPIIIPDYMVNNYSKNIYLKNNFYNPQLIYEEALSNYYWLIQVWGGIASFRRNERNDILISKFIAQLSKGNLTKETFARISSLSKIASFITPNKYSIYDSRAIYALNWLLFNHTELPLFPQPPGRSAELSKYDMQTIFRLSKREFEYVSYKHAYHSYCELLKELTSKVFEEEAIPYKVEMLLFMIAPTIIIEDIKASVSLTIKNHISYKCN